MEKEKERKEKKKEGVVELYRRIKLLGEGSYGKAYLVECVSDQ